ncbi:hypothetical protein COCCU_06835 [Corynebacterium occultum]|uniref:Uncharacterized protein n=1 Tax=Corynebacterium occultum TaxID=2675219 RepID=A0A6B8VP13_9CORY|nr:hypothetical protein COCCU_06835 [Corynebacterium occultum]
MCRCGDNVQTGVKILVRLLESAIGENIAIIEFPGTYDAFGVNGQPAPIWTGKHILMMEIAMEENLRGGSMKKLISDLSDLVEPGCGVRK